MEVHVQMSKGDCICKLDLNRPSIRVKHIIYNQGPKNNDLRIVRKKIHVGFLERKKNEADRLLVYSTLCGGAAESAMAQYHMRQSRM